MKLLTRLVILVLFGVILGVWSKKMLHPTTPVTSNPAHMVWGMKLVNETVTDHDLDGLHDLGIMVLEGEWGMADASSEEVVALLDRLHDRGMQLIMNFSDEAAWGYESTTAPLAPVWQREQVQHYVAALQRHPALYGYDIANEAGENLPQGDSVRLTLAQMQQAATDVRAIDATHPIVIRMHYWDEEDQDFTSQNPFGTNIADLVVLNLYSNYTTDGIHPAVPDMVRQSADTLVHKIKAIDPDVSIWLSLAAFREMPHFVQPSSADLARDIKAALNTPFVSGISFFGWGPERYPDEPPGWYLPRDGEDLLTIIKTFLT